MFQRILSMVIPLFIFAVLLFSQNYPDKKSVYGLHKDTGQRVGRTLINAGNWSYWIYNTGTSGNDPNGDPGGVYPRGTAALIFTDGLIWGGYVRDTLSQNPRVGGVTYWEGVQQGWIVTPGDGINPPVAVNPNDPRAAVWRIRPDYQDLLEEELRLDAAELYLKRTEDVTDEDIQSVYEQYAYDWANWPVDLGAPYYDVDNDGTYTPGLAIDLDGNGVITLGEREEPGFGQADQVVWCVYNDLDGVRFYGSHPMGLEQQVTTWVYDQPSNPAGQLIFRRFILINKSGVRMDSMYVCQWSDVDIGNYTNDFAGCDSINGIGFGYTAYSVDSDYASFGLPPAAVGYALLQGPLTEGKAGQDLNRNGIDDNYDRGYHSGKMTEEGYINLPMTAFFFQGPGSPIIDPPLPNYDQTLEYYNGMRGYQLTTNLINPSPWIVKSGPKAGKTTKFPLHGDPVKETGDVDGLGNNYSPSDRRIGLSSGPFTFAPGDTQEIIVAIAGGIVNQVGGNNLNAISQMRFNLEIARYIHQNRFQYIPRAPARPHVIATPLEDRIILEWGSDRQRVAETESGTGFRFEGYNVYQLPSPSATIEQAVKIATFDLVNGIRLIEGTRYAPNLRYFVTYPIQEGYDSGIRRFIEIDKDHLTGKRLYAGTPYYFSVTAYNFTDDPDIPEPSIESSLWPPVAVIPQGSPPGIRYEGEFEQQLTIEHVSGASEGEILVQVIDPAVTTGDRYEIFFSHDTVLSSPTYGELMWNLRNLEQGIDMLTGQPQIEIRQQEEDQPIVDGLQIAVAGPEITFTSFQVVSNSNSAIEPPEMGCLAFSLNGFPYLFNELYPWGTDRPDGSRQQTNGSTWGIHTGRTDDNDGRFDYFESRTTQEGSLWAEISPHDWEIRFTYDASSRGLAPGAYSGGSNMLIEVPFELWRTGAGTPNDPSDDVRMFPYVRDNNADRMFNINPVDHPVSLSDNDPETDWFYWVMPEDTAPGETGYLDLLNKIQADVPGYVFLYGTAGEVMRHMVLVNWNGGAVNDPAFPANLDAVMPEPGTVFRITTSKPNSPADRFQFTAPSAQYDPAVAQNDVEKINVFPNPYMAVHANEPDRFTRFVTFTHLPRKAVIRIFNLAGVLVRKLDKNSPDQFFRWDLRNESNYSVASGLYIALIDMPELGRQKILKIMIIQPVEWLKYY